MKKAAFSIVKSGVILGAGAQIVSGGAATGLSNMAASLPAAGTIHGAAYSMKLLKGIGKK